MSSEAPTRPRWFVAIGAFFVFGAAMAAYAAATLLKPGTFLDTLWALNKRGHAGLASLGRGAVLLFAALFVLLALAAVGWLRRKYWGWMLGVTIHCRPRDWGSHQQRDGRLGKGTRRSGDRGAAAHLYSAAKGARLF